MIPVSTLYDEYIDRQKLSEQKKTFDYIVPPPLKRVRNKKTYRNRSEIQTYFENSAFENLNFFTAISKFVPNINLISNTISA